MSILFVLLTFLIVISINYFHFRLPQAAGAKAQVVVRPRVPVMAKEAGFSIPQDYSFHPGHTWVARESGDNARIGLDKFAAGLVGAIDRIDVMEAGRWVRQGQRLAAIHLGGVSFDLLSPVEGVVTAVNNDALRDPSLVTKDPYNNGWIAIVKSPDLTVNQRNLIQGPMVAPWMQNNLSHLKSLIAPSPALAQDGGVPVSGLLPRLTPELRQKVVQEFFLS